MTDTPYIQQRNRLNFAWVPEIFFHPRRCFQRISLPIFLGEAAGIGFIGGLGGVLLGWSSGQVINVLALSYLTGQSAQQGGPPPSTAVFTPLWLPIFAYIFATLIGVRSGIYPALRAATMIPVTALKYE
jgi:putative ABC transport system permease protein